jgi:hypothetical protein
MSVYVINVDGVGEKEPFDRKHLTLGDMYKLAVGGAMIPVLYKGKPWCFVLPSLKQTFEAKIFPNKDLTKAPGVSVTLELRSALWDQDAYAAFQMLKAADERILELLILERDRVLPMMKRFTHNDEKVRDKYLKITAPRTTTKSDALYPPALFGKIKLEGSNDGATLFWENYRPSQGEEPIRLHSAEDVKDCYHKDGWLKSLCQDNGLYVKDSIKHSFKMVQNRRAKESVAPAEISVKEEDLFGVKLGGTSMDVDYGSDPLI